MATIDDPRYSAFYGAWQDMCSEAGAMCEYESGPPNSWETARFKILELYEALLADAPKTWTDCDGNVYCSDANGNEVMLRARSTAL